MYKTFSKVEGVVLTECLTQLSSNARHWKELVAEEEDPSPKKTDETEEEVDRDGIEPLPVHQVGRKKMQRRVSPIVFDIRHTQASPLTLDEPVTS